MNAYAMAATVDFGLEAKQGLLDLRSENARLRLVDAAVPRRAEAPGVRRPRPGAGQVQRQGPVRVSPEFSGPLATTPGTPSQPRGMNSGTSIDSATRRTWVDS